MAGDAIVGALRVVLGMDTASFEDGAKKAANSAESFGTKLAAVFGGVGLERIVERVFDKITETFKEAITKGFEFADQMGKMAQKVGVSVEQLTGLRLAAELSDVSMETLSKSMGTLSQQIVAAGSGTKTARDQFAALGINVRDSSGHLKSAIDVLAEIADKFEHTSDGATKTTAALALLGKGGKDLIPLLNEGSGSLKDLAETAKNMGLVVSTNTANQVQKFNDDLKIVGFTMQGIANLVIKDLIAGLGRMSSEFAASAKSGDDIRAAATAITNIFKELVVQIIITIETFRLLSEVFAIIGKSAEIGTKEIGKSISDNIVVPFADAAVAITDKVGSFISALFAIKSAAEPLQEEFGGIGDAVTTKIPPANAELMKIAPVLEQLGKVVENVRSLMPKLFEETTAAAHKAHAELDPAKISPYQQELNKLAIQTGVLKGNFDQLAPGLPEMAARFGLVKDNASNLTNSVSVLSPQLLALNNALLGLQGAQLTQAFLDPWDLWKQKVQSLSNVFAAGKIDQDTFIKASVKNAADLASAYGTAAQSIVSPMADAFKTLATMNKQYAGVAKAAAIAEALVNTYLAATKALASGFPPFNYVAAAAVTAAGLVNVAKISATQFATGGSFKVGGAGGIDSQLVQFQASPGEMVDVRKGENARSGGTTELMIPSIKPKDFFSGETVRELLIAVDQWHKDGGQNMRFAT